ncbi:MAG: hypothetical protein CFE24_14620 [Flavobacterium sp. BFFFF2]|nr:MAG: hypothetical protein CFE24_14620 [Flavobacterium sp. BFFFF2]
MTFYAGQKGPFFWFVFFGPAKKMNKNVNQQKYVWQKTKGLMNRIPKCSINVNRSAKPSKTGFCLFSFFFSLSSDFGPAKKMNNGLATEIGLAENKRSYEKQY